MGISNDTHVVIYDNNATFGFYSAGRPWWMFKVIGYYAVPGMSCMGGEKRGWYTQFTHAQFPQDF